MSYLRAIWNSPFTFWSILALPGLAIIGELLRESDKLEHLLLPTGEFAARFLIISLMITPLMFLTNSQRWVRWLMARRRYIGVAAACYSALHVAIYLLDKGSLGPILQDLVKIGIWTGWLASLIFIPLTVTSNDWFIAQLGSRWKNLQKLAYAAAVLVFAHWVLVDYKFGPALVHFTPLLLLELYRYVHVTNKRKERKLSAHA
ncbi:MULTISPECIES: ferric reductase-like transmembrane domain-containing protein [unclassified Pseudovibrio]|uniref:sulfite oxidase heme-binding subunit YedZ n=1 Tax=unclassified Pseudovibrio TaxID=2627060 RepID=UPI0007AE4A4F|nr:MULTISPECIES: ferric reductase-like transmembrane domain-containing protein [unclassified Pseudovibrio]KZK98743.1 Sulfoxide reductase heme-binding subunit YedZ [Pseudovibrio sp. W74]KZL09235.1 Sulfoxide reductase heme-binding subunit YedZ [Pseudovibrio sp. Ad14]